MGSELIGMPKHFFLIQAWLDENIVAFLGGGGEVLPTARRARRGSECLKDTFFFWTNRPLCPAGSPANIKVSSWECPWNDAKT